MDSQKIPEKDGDANFGEGWQICLPVCVAMESNPKLLNGRVSSQIISFWAPGLDPLTPVPFEMALRYKTRFTETVRLF